ncbi:MAG: DUF222 domain-containing protein [Candidatus Nanopelagicales bacterium]
MHANDQTRKSMSAGACSAGPSGAAGTAIAAGTTISAGATGCMADAPGVGPAFELLADLDDAASQLHQVLADGQAAPVDLTELAEQLHKVITRLQAAHHTAVGQIAASGELPPGPLTVDAWLGASHRLDRGRAGRLRRNAVWLADHPRTATEYAAGRITDDHVSAIRVVAQANTARREAFPAFESLILDAAVHADARLVSRIMATWAETVDPDTSDDAAAEAHERRRLHLSEVGDGWDLRGWLPAMLGAELAGILNAFMEQGRQTGAVSSDHGPGGTAPGRCEPVSARRADALLDAARAAADAGLTARARDRARATVTISLESLHQCDACAHAPGDIVRTCTCTCTGDHAAASPAVGEVGADTAGADDAAAADAAIAAALAAAGGGAEWRVGNGTGQGHLPHALARWATCDGEINRLVLGPGSRPLDIGRTQRTIPPHLRRALDVRDGGCIVPGCDRPPGWCEAHHIKHWADGGITSLENSALLCSKHHHELHLGHWTIDARHGKPRATPIRRGRRRGPPWRPAA